jgi:ribose-phosphate pyrophosphokinase
MVEKRRVSADTEALTLVGEVAGHDVVIVDDEVDTGGTVANSVEIVREHGARDVYICFAHAILSPPAVERLSALDVEEIITTNSIPCPADRGLTNMTVLSVAPLLGKVIQRVHEGRSVGEIFRGYQEYE